MTKEHTISWIFLAIASQNSPTNINAISSIADGINHAIPTQKELQISISFLKTNGLIDEKGKNYNLTEKGKIIYSSASDETKTLFEIWKKLDEIIK